VPPNFHWTRAVSLFPLARASRVKLSSALTSMVNGAGAALGQGADAPQLPAAAGPPSDPASAQSPRVVGPEAVDATSAPVCPSVAAPLQLARPALAVVPAVPAPTPAAATVPHPFIPALRGGAHVGAIARPLPQPARGRRDREYFQDAYSRSHKKPRGRPPLGCQWYVLQLPIYDTGR